MPFHAFQTPDPHCASCNGTFVEKVSLVRITIIWNIRKRIAQLDNPEDDPRALLGPGGGMDLDEEMDGLQTFGLLGQFTLRPSNESPNH